MVQKAAQGGQCSSVDVVASVLLYLVSVVLEELERAC